MEKKNKEVVPQIIDEEKEREEKFGYEASRRVWDNKGYLGKKHGNKNIGDNK